MHKLATLTALLLLFAHPRAAAADPSDDWGGGRVFIEGREIVPPVEFTGFGGSVLFANRIVVDPMPCEPFPDDFPVFWGGDKVCGTSPYHRPLDDPWGVRIERQQEAVRRLLALSALPLVMIGCDYFYHPDPQEAALVLFALDVGNLDEVAAAGAPEEAVEDLRRVLARP